jgi:hypothetical protein
LVQKPEISVRKTEVSIKKHEVSGQKPEVSVRKPVVSGKIFELETYVKAVFQNASVAETRNFELLCIDDISAVFRAANFVFWTGLMHLILGILKF